MGTAASAGQPIERAAPEAGRLGVMTAAAPLLTVEALRVEFPMRDATLVAVDGVSFSIAPGEVLGVVGESGAGKSVTGAAIIGLIDPPGRIAGGRVMLGERRIDDLPLEAMRRVRGREIGAVFQDPLTSLNPLYTIGRQLVETIITHLDLSPRAARQRALDLLTEVGIPAPKRRIDQYPHQFSGGMRQRVVIALALAAKPKLIIADEPTTALDVSIQAQIITLLKRLCREHGTAVMLITHDMGVIAETAQRVVVMYAAKVAEEAPVAELCDRVVVMYLGRIVEEGPVLEIFDAPRHPYTVGLLASRPRARLDGTLAVIPGSVPDLRERPTGCPFHPRCPEVMPRCSAAVPKLMPVGERQLASCFLHHDEAEPA